MVRLIRRQLVKRSIDMIAEIAGRENKQVREWTGPGRTRLHARGGRGCGRRMHGGEHMWPLPAPHVPPPAPTPIQPTPNRPPTLPARAQDYEAFWTAFGRYVKLGCIEDADNKTALAPLLRFPSSATQARRRRGCAGGREERQRRGGRACSC